MNSIKAIQTVSEVPLKLNKTETAVAANKLATARSFTIGSSNKLVDGSQNVNWSLSEIGAAPASHTHDYLPLSGGTVSGPITASSFYFQGAYAVKGDSSRIMRLQSGGTSPAAAGGWKTIVFPIAYTSIPRVVVSFEYDISLARPLNIRNITLTSFEVRVHDAGVGGTINWISYGY